MDISSYTFFDFHLKRFPNLNRIHFVPMHSAGAGAERRRSSEQYGSELRQEGIIINIKLYTRYTISVGQRSHQYVLIIYIVL